MKGKQSTAHLLRETPETGSRHLKDSRQMNSQRPASATAASPSWGDTPPVKRTVHLDRTSYDAAAKVTPQRFEEGPGLALEDSDILFDPTSGGNEERMLRHRGSMHSLPGLMPELGGERDAEEAIEYSPQLQQRRGVGGGRVHSAQSGRRQGVKPGKDMLRPEGLISTPKKVSQRPRTAMQRSER